MSRHISSSGPLVACHPTPGYGSVLPGLYVGNYRDSKDSLQLERFEITHIVAIHDTPRKLHLDKHYLCIMASDTPDQNLTQYFPLCNDFIHAARLRGGHVPVVPSLAGMSRSVTVAVAYIMSVTTLNWKEALKVVRVGRSVANPNFGFQKQLQEFEAFKLLEERRRMKERFPSLLLVNQDEEQCRLMLHSYQSLILSRDLCEGDCSLGQTCPTGLCRSPSKRLLRRKSSSARNTPPQSPRILPATPEPSATGLPRSSSTLSRRPRSGPAGLHYYTASAPPSRSGSRLDVSDLSGFEWTRGGSAPVSPQSSPPVSPQHFLRRRASVVANKRGT
uniref:Dual specificity protein phosphatase 15 n=1 Tax=Timema cristinae TaxID=61476 RepID=A0A7R9CQB0_TIMCR|nr:unnamed protein product [Timema cristinae]